MLRNYPFIGLVNQGQKSCLPFLLFLEEHTHDNRIVKAGQRTSEQGSEAQ